MRSGRSAFAGTTCFDGRNGCQGCRESLVWLTVEQLQACADEFTFLDVDAQCGGAFFHACELFKFRLGNGEAVANDFDFFFFHRFGFVGRSRLAFAGLGGR